MLCRKFYTKLNDWKENEKAFSRIFDSCETNGTVFLEKNIVW